MVYRVSSEIDIEDLERTYEARRRHRSKRQRDDFDDPPPTAVESEDQQQQPKGKPGRPKKEPVTLVQYKLQAAAPKPLSFGKKM